MINYDYNPKADTPYVSRFDLMVMLIDDQLMIGEAVRRALEDQEDINFHYCQNPARALQEAQNINPTVILLDLVMPDVDGLTLLRFFRAHSTTRDIPILMLSMREDARTKADAFAQGAHDYLVKLPEKVELVARIRHHSMAYIHRLQRDEAFAALRASQKELEAKNLELLRLTQLDGLTGLANRRHFDEYLTMEWRRAQRNGQPLSLILLDVDYFKIYNDTYGHLKGDECLRTLAGIIKEAIKRPADLAARYGGEEFAIILPETDVLGAKKIAEDIHELIRKAELPHVGSTHAGQVTVSLGVAGHVPAVDTSYEELIQQADQLLYKAKREGRNQVRSQLAA